MAGMLCVCDAKVESAAELRSCRNPGLNRGPLDLQSNALPTELFRLTNVTFGDTNSESAIDNVQIRLNEHIYTGILFINRSLSSFDRRHIIITFCLLS